VDTEWGRWHVCKDWWRNGTHLAGNLCYLATATVRNLTYGCCIEPCVRDKGLCAVVWPVLLYICGALLFTVVACQPFCSWQSVFTDCDRCQRKQSLLFVIMSTSEARGSSLTECCLIRCTVPSCFCSFLIRDEREYISAVKWKFSNEGKVLPQWLCSFSRTRGQNSL
jgi:hypothetical protein